MKVIKLKSGEELIAEVSETDDNRMVLNSPMVFKTIMIHDKNGYPTEGIVLKNWLVFGNEKETSIPNDFIATMLEPTTDVISHYLIEKEKQSIRYETKSIEDVASSNKKPEMTPEQYESLLNDMFDSIFNDIEQEPKPKSKSKKPKENLIHMNMIFPPQVLAHMINEGMIDPREIMDMINHFGLNKPKKKKKKKESINDDKFTGDQIERPDFGNKWTDWNPDPSSDEYK